MRAKRARASVVDDDKSVRESPPDLIRIFGFDVRTFSSAAELLDSESLSMTDCLILDVAIPGMSGPGIEEELIRRGERIPVVFITAHKDENDGIPLMQNGAVACLFKPFSDVALQETLDRVFDEGSQATAVPAQLRHIRHHRIIYDRLRKPYSARKG